jgi:hypothetical protein
MYLTESTLGFTSNISNSDAFSYEEGGPTGGRKSIGGVLLGLPPKFVAF